MTGGCGNPAVSGRLGNDEIAAQLAATRRRRIWRMVIGVNVFAMVVAIAGCLLMMKSQGLKVDVSKMRDEVGETVTMMSLGGANEAVAKYLPSLIDTTGRWERKFDARSEEFRGMDLEINQVQAMKRLGRMAEGWRRDLEGISPMQRNELWQRNIKMQVDAEQKSWPNRTHQKGASEWLLDIWKEFWYGLKHGLVWPVTMYENVSTLIKGGSGVDRLDVGERFRFVLFPYRLPTFTMLRVAGITIMTSMVGYLFCWLGLKSRLGWFSYIGLLYFLYLFNIALFIVWLEVTK